MFQPLPHQIVDAKFLASRKFAGCFNGMGTGKTRTALMALVEADVVRAVIIAPPIALRMWAVEAEDHMDCTAQIIASGKTKIDPKADVLICSYEIATKRQHDLMQWLRDYRSAVICDESHALKSVKAKRTKAILGKGGITETAKHTWLLTGSPVTRWNDDLIPFLFRAAPEDIKAKTGGFSIDRFLRRYCITQKKQFGNARFPTTVVVGSRNEAELGHMLAKVSTRRTLHEVATSMPSLSTRRFEVAGDSSIVRQINRMTAKEIEQGLLEAEEHLATLRRELGLSMIPAAVEYITDLAEQVGTVLVGAWHRDVIDTTLSMLRAAGLKAEKLDGTTSAARKTELQEAFNAKEIDVLVGQIGAMGVSLNLQRGSNRIVVIEEDWSPSIMDQFYARLHRMGQTLPVYVDTLYVDTKLATAINRIASEKRRSHAAIAAAQQEEQEC